MNQGANEVSVSGRIYQLLVEEEDTRVCKDIPDSACTHVPANFFRIGAAQTLTKLADEIVHAKTVLPWLLGALGAPAFWVGFLVPVRESMSMLPQLVIAGAVRKQAQRKYVWLLGAFLQALAIAGMACTALVLRGPAAGLAVVALVFFYSLSRGLCSVASKDVIGKTIPKTRRGRITGYASTAAGVGTLLLGLFLTQVIGQEASPGLFALLLAAAALLWLGALAVFAAINETPGATEGGGNALTEALKRLDILRTDAAFRRFVLVRALLISTALSGPYYIVLARESGESSGKLLGLFVLASGLASTLSSAVWGRFADQSSRRVLIAAAACTSVLGLLVAAFQYTGLLGQTGGWLLAAAYLLLSISHSGVRIARKTFVLDLAGGQRRTDYVAVSNTVIGAILLASGAVTALTPILGPAGMLVLLSCIGLTGVLLALALPETE